MFQKFLFFIVAHYEYSKWLYSLPEKEKGKKKAWSLFFSKSKH